MQAINTHIDETTNLNFIPFRPAPGDETAVASIIRKMLHYHVLRVQLEGSRPWMDNHVRLVARRRAKEVRLKGFAEEREAVDAHIRVIYDDEMLRREGTRIAYMIARDQLAEALAYEEEIIAVAVNHSLYGTELEDMAIAA